MEVHPVPETNDSCVVESCAGLSYVGTRRLSGEEHAKVYRTALLSRGVALLFLAFALISFFILSPLVSTFISRSSPAFSPVKILITLVAPLISIFAGLHWMECARRLRAVSKANKVRCFRGRLNRADYTDPAPAALTKAKLLKTIDPEAEISLELLPQKDVVFSFNGVRVRAYVPVHVTRAVPQPEDAVVLDAPVSWVGPELASQLDRRRLSLAEVQELLSYARIGFKSWLWLLVQGYCIAVLVRFSLSRVHVKEDVTLWASLIMAGLVILARLYHIRKANRAIRHDAMLGWTIVNKPGSEGEDMVVEVLPFSSVIWTMNGKPAGWRRAARAKRS